MKNMSFALTTRQYRRRTKDVTRRLGWLALKPGQRFMGVVKGMGLRKGEQVQRLHAAEATHIWREELRSLIEFPAYGQSEVIREGFPHLTPAAWPDGRPFTSRCRRDACATSGPVRA